MNLNLELTTRQTNRVVEQALRAHASLEIEPRNLPAGDPLDGQLVGREGTLLAISIPNVCEDLPLNSLVGAFCEIRTILSDELYQFSTCVLDLVDNDSTPRILVATPEKLFVANRRQYERTNATVASQVRLWIPGQTGPTVGLLADVCADGLGCNLAGDGLDDVLALDDRLRATFEIAGFDETFELPVVLCNKNICPDTRQLTLGMRFAVESNDLVGQHALFRLRTALFELLSNTWQNDGEL